MKENPKSGFTLIELLVVIAIIAILAVVVVLTLNPAELLRQSRDSNRVSDLATLKSALSIYSEDVLPNASVNPSLGTTGVCYNSTISTSTTIYTPNTSGVWVSTTTCAAWFASATTISTTSGRGVTGSGWIPVNFSAISAGSPIGAEPVDPVNTDGTSATKGSGAFFYGYITNGTTFKLSALMESSKYSASGTNDVESTDGGLNNFIYEQGSNLAL